MDRVIKIRFFLVLLCYINTLQGAIGCQLANYTPDHWDVSLLQYQKCSCPCRNVLSARGRCSKCKHYGDPRRGEITKAVLAPFETILH